METPKAVNQGHRSIYTPSNRKYSNPPEETLKRAMAKYIILRKGEEERKRIPLNQLISRLPPRPIMRRRSQANNVTYNIK